MRRCLYLLLIVLSFTPVSAQQETLKFESYSIDDGMLQSTVNSTLKDSRGFIWFATQVGLNRFDGYTFKAYKSVPSDTTSLSGNWLWNLTEDSKGRLWIGTFSGGLNRYRYESDDFVRYSLSKSDSSSTGRVGTWAWLERKDGKFWVGFDTGMAILDPEDGSFDMLNFPEYSTHAFAIQRDSKGNIWVASTTGLHKVHPETHKLERYPYFPDDTTRGTGNISRMIVDQNDLIWF
ncbi:MAG: two-component regulator propeller domain-containing protein, partial [Calditrichota bacterium]